MNAINSVPTSADHPLATDGVRPGTAPAPGAASTAATPSPATRTGLIWWQAALLGAGAAVVVNLGIWLVASLAGAPLTLPDGAGTYPITAGSVVFSSVVPMIVGISLAGLIARWWPGGIRLAQVLGALLAVVTLGGVFPGADAATGTALTLMHLTSGVVVVLALEAMRRRIAARTP